MTVGLVALDVDDGVDGLPVDSHEPTSRVTHRVESASLNEGLDESLIAYCQADLIEEGEEIGGWTVLLPGANNLSYGIGPDISDGPQAEPNVLTDSGELKGGCVDVGRKDVDVLGAHVS